MFISFLSELWFMISSIALYMFLGFIIAGVMNHFFSINFITKQIGVANKLSIIKSAMLGVPIPLCSCSVLPVAKTLKNLGASNSAVLAFLITTPVTGLDSFYLTLSVLGIKFAIARIVLVIIIGILAGFLSLHFLKEEQFNVTQKNISSCCSKKNKKTFFDFFYYSFYELPKSIANSLVYGLIAGAIITMILPNFPILQNEYLSILTALLISIPFYVCASGSVPVALALLNAGFSHGAVLAFLVAGPASNLVSIFTIKNILGIKNLKIYLLTIFICTLIASIFFNFISFNFLNNNIHHHKHKEPELLYLIINIVFLLMIFYYFLLNFFKNIKKC